MNDFGDKDPEDAYDAGDELGERLAVIRRAIVHLRARRLEERFDGRRADLRRLVAAIGVELDEELAGLVGLALELEAL
jgi:hypothetical protein